MSSNALKLIVVMSVLALVVIVIGGISTTSADVPAQGRPPTVALPTRVGTRPPTLTATPTKAGVPPNVASTPVAPLKGGTRTPTRVGLRSPRGGYATTWTTAITYQNVGTAATTSLHILFYADYNTTTPVDYTASNLNPLAAASLFVGSVGGLSSPFNGSAVIQADQPIAAALVQLPQGSTTVKNRPLSNGLSSGSATSLLATVLKNYYDTHTKFSVQNTDSQDNNITAKFYNTSAVLVHTASQTGVKPGASWHVNAADIGALGSSFSGSVVIEAKRADTSNGSAVSSAMELEISGNGAKAFEGVASGAMTVYMPSALCNYGASSASTAYAVQNTSLTTATDVTVTYNPGGYFQTQNIGPGAKKSFIACNAGVGNGFVGSATVTSSSQPIVAIGKAYDATGMGTAFVGVATGAQRISLPYVRYANDTDWAAGTHQRTYITIQNIGGSSVSNVTVKYYNPDGSQAGSTHTIASIAAGAKAVSNATNAGLSTFGYGTPIGGAAVVEGPPGAQLAVIARVSTQVATNQYVSEDYSGIPY